MAFIPKDVKDLFGNVWRTCRECNEAKLLKDYHKNKSCSLGHTSTCRICEWDRRKKWYADKRKERQDRANELTRTRKLEAISQFNNRCLDCGKSYPSCVYQFHHIDHKEKDYNPSYILKMSKARRDKELAKCVMLCANCHMIRHYGKSDWTDRKDGENGS